MNSNWDHYSGVYVCAAFTTVAFTMVVGAAFDRLPVRHIMTWTLILITFNTILDVHNFK